MGCISGGGRAISLTNVDNKRAECSLVSSERSQSVFAKLRTKLIRIFSCGINNEIVNNSSRGHNSEGSGGGNYENNIRPLYVDDSVTLDSDDGATLDSDDGATLDSDAYSRQDSVAYHRQCLQDRRVQASGNRNFLTDTDTVADDGDSVADDGDSVAFNSDANSLQGSIIHNSQGLQERREQAHCIQAALNLRFTRDFIINANNRFELSFQNAITSSGAAREEVTLDMLSRLAEQSLSHNFGKNNAFETNTIDRIGG